MLRHDGLMLRHESSMISLIYFEIVESKSSQASNTRLVILSHSSKISFNLVKSFFRCHAVFLSGTRKGLRHYTTTAI
jgi:hypothetical protein